jgi:outer membrane lipoprotein SlyB
VLEPKATATEIGEMQPINSMARLTNEINQNVVGLVAGGVIGGLIGAVLGMGFFSIITGPIGMVVGAIAGGYAMGGQPFLDAVNAVVSGQP